MKAENLIVGAGISGAAMARIMAEHGQSVLIIDARDHIGGNCYDYCDGSIMVHRYGTHIFHTGNRTVWDFCSRFTKWYPYQHKVLALVDGQTVPVPFNLNSLRMVFPRRMADGIESRLIEHFGFGQKVSILKLRETDDKELKFLANYIYEKIFREYTLKQWGLAPDEISPSVTERVPVHVSRDDRYFQDKYQGIPLDGYTAMIANMLDHPNIKVELKTPYSRDMKAKRVLYTGTIDEFFEYRLGELPYRSVRLDFVKFDKSRFGDAAVVNYPCNYNWTRIGEYKWFLDNRTPHTIVSFEYPETFERGKNERCYPVASDANSKLYAHYLSLQEENMENVYFFGRLGDYKYYDMDGAVARAMELFKKVAQ